jgi:hypothetical protein
MPPPCNSVELPIEGFSHKCADNTNSPVQLARTEYRSRLLKTRQTESSLSTLA